MGCDAELAGMTERQKMRQQRKLMLTVTFFNRVSVLRIQGPSWPWCSSREMKHFGRNLSESPSSNPSLGGPNPDTQCHHPSALPCHGGLTWGFALQEMDATGLLGEAKEIVKASCFPLLFTMHLLFHWKYEPARLMLGITLERKKTKGSSCLG